MIRVSRVGGADVGFSTSAGLTTRTAIVEPELKAQQNASPVTHRHQERAGT
jgi:hypothetical protein